MSGDISNSYHDKIVKYRESLIMLTRPSNDNWKEFRVLVRGILEDDFVMHLPHHELLWRKIR